MRAEQMLTLVLRCNAVILFSALPVVFFPTTWMDTIHRGLGMGPLPTAPVVEYLTRTVSALCAFAGVIYWYISADVLRYGPVIRLLGILHVIMGALLFCLDLIYGLPTLWAVIEGPPLLIVGIMILVLQSRIQSPT
jgi:hypothetical protein